ncbi:hypothetical protein [Paenarthrobacter sp. C1]|uniref:hypothetical protein n=1 Tax=Paenarthrobacter sp. C1 TaxID=3400220 RepID=UPI003BF5940D
MPPDAVFTGMRTSLDGSRSWWIEGVAHRIDGPAVIRADGSLEWYVHGRRVDGAALDDLYRSGDQLAIEAVLRAWRHDGPSADAIAAAVRGALAA